MNIPFLCVGAAFLLLYLTKIPLAVAMQRESVYDNHHPREQQARLQGWGKRALGAHLNSFETFAPFAAAVLIAHLGGADPAWSARLSVTFVTARILYTICYLQNWASLRSTIWMIGTVATGALLFMGIF